MSIVEDSQTIADNKSGISVSDDEVISDDTLALIVEEFNLLEILEYDKA